MWKHYSNLNSTKHLFCNSPVCAYRHTPNRKRMLVKSDLSRFSTLVENSKGIKPRCQVYDMLDTRRKKFREQAMPFNQKTTIVIHIALFIYSCVTNANLKIKSERHQTNYNLDLIIIKRASETTAGLTGGCSFPPTRAFS